MATHFLKPITYLSLIFYFLFLLLSCTQNETASINEVIPIDLHKTVNPPSSGEEWIEEMEFIRLETNDECFLASRSLMAMSKKNIAVSSDNTIHIFERSGKHINSFKREGKGPGEYVRIREICLMPNTDEVMISDPNGRKIMVYDFHGNPTFEVPVKFMMLDVVPVGPKSFACYIGRMTRAISQDSSLYEMVYINDLGEKIESFSPFKYTFPTGVTSVDFTGPGNFGEYYINLAYGYDIYQTGPGNLFERKYSFDYLDYSIDTTKLNDEKFMMSGEADRNLNGFTDLDHMIVNSNTILFWAPNIDSKEYGYRMINRETGNQKSIFWNTDQSIGNFHGIPIDFGGNSYGDYFYFKKDAIDLMEIIDELSDEQKKIHTKSKGYNGLAPLKEEDNPIIILYKVKNF